MMPLNLKGVFLTFILSTFSLSLQGKEISWTKVKEEHGVKVYKAEVLERIAFCGTGELKGEPERLISIIENPNGWKNWIENFKSGKVIEVIDPNHKIFYQAFDSPFPVSDRDVVYESKIFRDTPNKIRIEMQSVKHPRAPKTIGERVEIIFTRYFITKIDESTLHLRFETLSATGGALPSFLVNWASENYPVTIFQGLRKELKK